MYAYADKREIVRDEYDSLKTCPFVVPAWFDAMRALECLALCAYIFCIAFEVYEDFISKNARIESRKVELLAASAGNVKDFLLFEQSLYHFCIDSFLLV